MFRLTAERQKKGWSQSELGRQTGINSATISRLEAGKIFAYKGYRLRLARVLGIPEDAADQLFEQVPGNAHK